MGPPSAQYPGQVGGATEALVEEAGKGGLSRASFPPGLGSPDPGPCGVGGLEEGWGSRARGLTREEAETGGIGARGCSALRPPGSHRPRARREVWTALVAILSRTPSPHSGHQAGWTSLLPQMFPDVNSHWTGAGAGVLQEGLCFLPWCQHPGPLSCLPPSGTPAPLPAPPPFPHFYFKLSLAFYSYVHQLCQAEAGFRRPDARSANTPLLGGSALGDLGSLQVSVCGEP